MSAGAKEYTCYRFGEFEFQPARRRLFVSGRPATIGARAIDVLIALVERRERVVSNGELLDIVWPGVVVEENNVQVQISALRKLLGPHVIATSPGRGYQFTAVLEEARPRASISSEAGALDTSEPVEAFAGEAAARSDISLDPEPSFRVAGSHNLPEPDNELIGRDTDCSLLALELMNARLVTVVGPAGIGKTRVALAIARQLVERFRDGVCWVDLAALGSANALAEAIATAAGQALGPGDAVASLARAVRDSRMLVVLDNCERLAGDVAPLLRRVLEFSAGVRVLATSQVPLRLGFEQCYRIEPLQMPDAGAANEVARRAPALALLLKRAREVDLRFDVEDEQLSTAISLCRQLDGLPLAIELAAARLPMLGLHALHGMLHQRFELLNLARADAPRRQQTLQAALDWSCALLSPEEVDALQRLSIFTASFRLASALDVIDASERTSAVGTLSSLVAKSLVQADPREPGRYRLLESTRLHAARGLLQSGHAGRTRDQWRKTIGRLAREAERAFWESSDEAWLAAFKGDQPDVVAALEDSAAVGDIELAGDLGQAAQLWDYLQDLGGAVRRRMKMAVSLLRSFDAKPGDARSAGLLNMLTFFGELHPPRPLAWQRALEQRLATWQQRGDAWQIYRALNALAIQRASERQPWESRRLLDEAACMASPSWPPRLLGSGAWANAFVSMLERDAQSYRAHSATALALNLQAGAVQDQLRARVMLADARILAGEHREAAAMLEILAAEAEVNGQAFSQVGSTTLLTFAYLLADDIERGSTVAARALALAHEHFVADILLAGAAFVDARQAEFDRAARLLGCCSPYRPDSRLGWANEARLAAKTHAELLSVLAPSRLAELLAQGAGMDREQRFALMQQSFARPS